MQIVSKGGRGSEGATQIGRVVLALREMLLRGDFRAGERLTELALVPRLNASRTPVRLALERLAHEGLLEALPTTGFRVRVFTVEEIWDAIEIRGVLEGTAARFAAERLRSADELSTLRECCRAAEVLVPMDVDGFVRYLELNETFHRELWALAKSPMLVRTIESVAALPFAAPGALVFGNAETREASATALVAMEHHRALVEAIAAREGTRAESLAREHSRVARRNLDRALRDKAAFTRVPGAAFVRVPGRADSD
jgi:GntR family transcriptional regulator of vanillate catabolism